MLLLDFRVTGYSSSDRKFQFPIVGNYHTMVDYVDVGRLDAFQTHITEEQKALLASIFLTYDVIDG